MRKNQIFEMFVLAAREIFQRGELPKDTDTFFDLVRKYGRDVIPDVTESELKEISEFMSHLTLNAGDGACAAGTSRPRG